jgi:hypothetical protein
MTPPRKIHPAPSLSPALALAFALCALFPANMEANLPLEELENRLAGFEARQFEALSRQVSNTFPGPTEPAPNNLYAWNRLNFALAALYLNTQLEAASLAVIEASEAFLAADPATYAGAEHGLHWHGNLWVRIHELFAADSSHFPGRLTPAAEEAIRALLWEWAYRVGHLDADDFAAWKTWKIWESENHSAMHDASAWGAAKILRRFEPYRSRQYNDGSTAAQQHGLWTEFLVEYLRERGQRGMTVEYRSNTYSKYTLQGIYNYFDLAENPNLRYLAGAFLDLWWADAAQESIDGIAGGAGARMGRPEDVRGERHAVPQMIWYYTGEGQERNIHPGLMCLITSQYRIPLVVADIALDKEGRGSFEAWSRRPGLNLPGYEGQFAANRTYILDRDNGGILRYTYVTPDFVLGTHLFDKLPNARWSGISRQNRWHGLVIRGNADALIVPQVVATTSNLRGQNEQWSIQHKGTLITQKCSTGAHLAGMRVFFPDLSILARDEQGGWIFASNEHAYAAVRPARGGYDWVDNNWIELNEEYAPVIIEVVRAQDYPSLADFRSAILAQAIEINASLGEEALFYSSVLEGTDFTLFIAPATTRSPLINGEPVDHAPAFVHESPFVQGAWPAAEAGGPVTIRKGRYEKLLNFKADFSDPANPGEWMTPPVLTVSIVEDEPYGRNRATLQLQLSQALPVAVPVHLSLAGSGAAQVELSPPAGPYVIAAGSAGLSIDILRRYPDSLVLEDAILEIRFSQSDGYAWDYRDQFILSLPLLPYDQWRVTHFNESQRNDPLVSGPRAAPNNDGVANILKYLAGQSPWEAHSGLSVQTARAGNQLQITLPRSPQAVDLTIVPVHSENLVDWIPVYGDHHCVAIDGFDPQSGEYFIQVNLPVDSPAGRDFYRLEFSHPLIQGL